MLKKECKRINMTSSGETRLIEEHTVLSLVHIFVFKDCFQIMQKAKKVFSAVAHIRQKSRVWLDAAQNARCLIRACSLCPSISRVFQNDVTYFEENVKKPTRIYINDIWLKKVHTSDLWLENHGDCFGVKLSPKVP